MSFEDTICNNIVAVHTVLDDVKWRLNSASYDEQVVKLIVAQQNVVLFYMNGMENTNGEIDKYIYSCKAYAAAGVLNLSAAYLLK